MPSTQRLLSRPLVLIALGVVLLAAILYLFFPAAKEPPQLSGQITLLPQPKSLGEFELVDHRNQPFTPQRLEDHWSYVFFGYTHCPDICPTTLLELKRMVKTVAESNSEINPPQVVFVSIDPERDTPERLKEYVTYFNPDFVGVTGDQADIDTFAARLNVLAMRTPDPNNEDNYLMDHTASLLLINPDGHFQGVYSPPHDPQVMAQDYLELVRYYGDR